MDPKTYDEQMDAAVEARELRAINAELLVALRRMVEYPDVRTYVGTIIHDAALTAIAKAEGRS